VPQNTVSPTQAPPVQVSSSVQAFPSLQAWVVYEITHPSSAVHLVAVHSFPSSAHAASFGVL
jgi:hypothetical protein